MIGLEIEALMKMEREFWRHVEDGTEPEVDGSIATGEALDAVYPMDYGNDCDLGAYDNDVERYLELGEEIKELKKARDAHANAIKAFMGETGYGQSAFGRVSWAAHMVEKFDKDRFEREHPTLYSQYVSKYPSRTFRVTARKEA